jgi:hypothetical protein
MASIIMICAHSLSVGMGCGGVGGVGLATVTVRVKPLLPARKVAVVVPAEAKVYVAGPDGLTAPGPVTTPLVVDEKVHAKLCAVTENVSPTFPDTALEVLALPQLALKLPKKTAALAPPAAKNPLINKSTEIKRLT